MLSAQDLSALLDKVIDELGSGIFHFHAKTGDLGGEIIEKPHGGHGYEDTKGGRDQRFRNSSADGADTGVLIRFQGLESADDTNHGPKQSHERGGRTDG